MQKMTVSEKDKAMIKQLYNQNKNAGDQIGVRSPTGYVGMYNFGCTCYMNSLM